MTGSIVATCGHEVFSWNDVFPVEYPDTDERGSPVIVEAMFCRQCAAKIGETHNGKVIGLDKP